MDYVTLPVGEGGFSKPRDGEDVSEKMVFGRRKFACAWVMEEKKEGEEDGGGRELGG